jgi:hypothetical protein
VSRSGSREQVKKKGTFRSLGKSSLVRKVKRERQKPEEQEERRSHKKESTKDL